MIHNILLTRLQAFKGKNAPTYPGWSPEGPVPYTPWAGGGGKDDSNIAPFLTTWLAAFTHLLSNVMRSKCLLSHLILTLIWCLKYKTRSRWEKFASSNNPFFRVVQITIRATARIARNTTRSHPETVEECCRRRNQCWAAWAAWVRCKPSTPQCDPRTDELARSSRRRTQPFLLNHSEHNRACLPGPLWSSSREEVTHSVQVTRWARTRSCSRSSILAHNSSGSGSPPPSSRAAR